MFDMVIYPLGGDLSGGGVGGGSELSDQLLDPDVPTLASQDKLKVSPKGLPFVKKAFGHFIVPCHRHIHGKESEYEILITKGVPRGDTYLEFVL